MKRSRYNKLFSGRACSPDLPTSAHWFFVSLSSLILRSHRLEAVARDLFIRPRTAGRLITLGHPPAVSVLHTRDVASCARHMTRRRIACCCTPRRKAITAIMHAVHTSAFTAARPLAIPRLHCMHQVELSINWSSSLVRYGVSVAELTGGDLRPPGGGVRRPVTADSRRCGCEQTISNGFACSSSSISAPTEWGRVAYKRAKQKRC